MFIEEADIFFKNRQNLLNGLRPTEVREITTKLIKKLLSIVVIKLIYLQAHCFLIQSDEELFPKDSLLYLLLSMKELQNGLVPIVLKRLVDAKAEMSSRENLPMLKKVISQ